MRKILVSSVILAFTAAGWIFHSYQGVLSRKTKSTDQQELQPYGENRNGNRRVVAKSERKNGGVSELENGNITESPQFGLLGLPEFMIYLRTVNRNSASEMAYVLDKLSELPTGEKKSEFLNYFASALGQLSSEEAFSILNKINDNEDYQTGVSYVMSHLSRVAPEEAINILRREIENPYFSYSIVRFGSINSESLDGVKILKRFYPDIFRESSPLSPLMKSNFVRNLRRSSLIETQDLITEISNKYPDIVTAASFGVGESRYGPALSAGVPIDEVLRSVGAVEGVELKAETQRKLFKTLTLKDPIKAAEIFYTIPEESAVEVVSEIVSQWYSMESSEVGEWVSSQGPGPVKDRAIHTLIKIIGNDHPKVVREWEAQLTSIPKDGTMEKK